MNINMLSVLTIRINLIFRVALTLFIDSSLLDIIMNTVCKRGRRSIEESDEEQSQRITLIVTQQSPSLSKKIMKLMKGICYKLIM